MGMGTGREGAKENLLRGGNVLYLGFIAQLDVPIGMAKLSKKKTCYYLVLARIWRT